MSDDNFTQFAEEINDDLEFELIVKHKDVEVAAIGAYSLESLQEQFHKLDKPINEYINSAYQDLPDYDDRDEDDDEEDIELGNNGEPIKHYNEDDPRILR